MNLYAIQPIYSPDATSLYLFESDAQAVEHAAYVAAGDEEFHGSPEAAVFLVAADLRMVVGDAPAARAMPVRVSWSPEFGEKIAQEFEVPSTHDGGADGGTHDGGAAGDE